jgi:hypothetical protein
VCFDVVKNISILTGKVWLFCIKFVYLSKMCNLLKKIGCGLVASDLLGDRCVMRVVLAMFLDVENFMSCDHKEL